MFYVAALGAAGVQVEALSPLLAFPDSIFVEDAAFVLPEGAILLRPGAPSRAGEAAAIAPDIERHFGAVERVELGMIDGGDILILPDAILVGLSARTDREGAECFASWARRLGRTVSRGRHACWDRFISRAAARCLTRPLCSPHRSAVDSFEGLEVLVTAEGRIERGQCDSRQRSYADERRCAAHGGHPCSSAASP